MRIFLGIVVGVLLTILAGGILFFNVMNSQPNNVNTVNRTLVVTVESDGEPVIHDLVPVETPGTAPLPPTITPLPPTQTPVVLPTLKVVTGSSPGGASGGGR